MASSLSRILIGSIIVAGAVVAGCNDSVAPAEQLDVVLQSVPDTLDRGDSVHLTPVITDAAGRLVSRTVSWQTSNPAIATVDSAGWVHGVALGQVVITAAVGTGTASAPMTIANPIVVTFTATDTLQLGDSATFSATVFDRNGAVVADPALTWLTPDTLIARLRPTGYLVALGYGTVRLMARYGERFYTHVVEVPWTPEAPGLSLVKIMSGYSGVYCGLTSTGQAYCKGNNGYGELGTGTYSGSSVFVPVATTARFVDLEVGQYGVCALSTDAQIYCWGSNGYYEHSPIDTAVRRIHTPRPLETALRFKDITHTEHGQTCGVTTSNEPYCWGHNDNYQTGRSPLSVRLHGIARVNGGMALTEVDGNGADTCGVDLAGAVYCWGVGYLRYAEQSPDPYSVPWTVPLHGVSVASGTACALTSAGAAVCWGDNGFGGFGNGTLGSRSATPVVVNGGHQFTKLAGSLGHCGITVAGDLYCWGSYAGFREFNYSRPVRVAPDLKFRDITGDWTNSRYCAATTEGSTYCFAEITPPRTASADLMSATFTRAYFVRPRASASFRPIPR